MISAHRLNDTDLADLATGRGGAEVVQRLSSAQFSRRLLALRALMAASRGLAADDVRAFRAGYALATAVQEADQQILADLLMYPSTGIWLAHCLRRLRGTGQGELPVRADLGHLAAIAAAAAVRAGETFEIAVPLRAGELMLPTLGVARFSTDNHSECAVLRGFPGMLEIVAGRHGIVMPANPASDGPGWFGLRKLTATAGPANIAITLDDIDPFRASPDMAPDQRVPEADLARWRRVLEAAWSNLTTSHPWYASAIGAGLVMLVPLANRSGRASITATSRDAFGACLLSRPTEGQSLAVILLHEFQHGKLGALMDVAPLHRRGAGALGYSPWRADPRPLGGLLQGAYAYLGVTDYWHTELSRDEPGGSGFAAFEFARWRQQTRYAVQVLAQSGWLTETGCELVERMRCRLDQWHSVPVPQEPAQAAAMVIADHRLSWRLRNLRPDPADVHGLASAWMAGFPPPTVRPKSVVVTADRAMIHDAPRIDLICRQLGSLGLAKDLTPACSEAAEAADRAYTSGDLATALKAYHTILSANPNRTEAFAGFVLAGRWPPGSAMLRAPELVLAVYRRVREVSDQNPEPGELAAWLGPVTGWLDPGPSMQLD